MTRSLIRCGVLAGAVVLGACELVVQNPNNPETERVLQTPGDVEALLSSQYLRWHTGLYGSTAVVWGMSAVQSFENFSSLANNCLGARVNLAPSRAANDNSVGNVCQGEQSRIYFIESEVTRITSNVLAKLDEPEFTLGSSAQDARARAYAHFIRALALGYMAMVYDSASIVAVGQGGEDAGELSAYPEVLAASLDGFQEAIDAAGATVSGANGFPLPNSWLPTPTSLTSAEFIRLVRTYRARIRANAARTPAERAAVDWDAVIADAQNGITADHLNTTNTVNGPFKEWTRQFHVFTTWHQMTPFIIGMADKSGAYQAWLATPLDSRGAGAPFTMVTDDLRFPQGANRTEQQADFAVSSCDVPATACKRYFVNRPGGNDVTTGASWGWSNYDFARFRSWTTRGDAGTARNGNIVFFTKAELDLLEAEGHFRKGAFASAAALINRTRTANGGLPAITAFDGTSPVPGGAACVPNVPVGPAGTTTACGNMFEALKWEKRIETSQTHFAPWFLDGRGWGDLPELTGLDWPTPYQDLLARVHPIYSSGGGTGYNAAPRSGYGW